MAPARLTGPANISQRWTADRTQGHGCSVNIIDGQNHFMKILTAKYINGHLELPEGCLQEGDVVTLLVPDPQREFILEPEEREYLEAAIAQARTGQGIDGWDMLDQLRS